MVAKKKPTTTAASVSAPAAAKTADTEAQAEKIETTAPVTGDVADSKADEEVKSDVVVSAETKTPAEKIETAAPVTGDVADSKAAEEAKSESVVGAGNIAINSSLETKPDNGEPGEQVEVIFVRSRPKHFYRAGIKFTEKGHGIVIDTLSEQQLLAIMTEPQLLCEHGFIDADVVAGDAE